MKEDNLGLLFEVPDITASPQSHDRDSGTWQMAHNYANIIKQLCKYNANNNSISIILLRLTHLNIYFNVILFLFLLQNILEKKF